VRLTARTALWQYHLAGFRGSNPPPAGPQTNEPPLAQSGPRPAPSAANRGRPAATPRPGSQTNEPPLAATRPSPGLRVEPSNPLRPPPANIKIDPAAEPPLVITPPPRPAVPSDMQRESAKPAPTPPAKPAAPKPTDDGPILNP